MQFSNKDIQLFNEAGINVENKNYTNVTRAAYGNGLYTLKAKPVALNADATSDENKV